MAVEVGVGCEISECGIGPEFVVSRATDIDRLHFLEDYANGLAVYFLTSGDLAVGIRSRHSTGGIHCWARFIASRR